ncbi:hypothetical protein BD769DRAFT_1749565 [Suillus cothurnatus]|nr:hypothetical protein BD769DRAFT_1749565 [Suillus cothurnatus]
MPLTSEGCSHVNSDVQSIPHPPSSLTIHVNMNNILLPSKNVFTFSITGTILIISHPHAFNVGSNSSPDGAPDPIPIVLPRFSMLECQEFCLSLPPTLSGPPPPYEDHDFLQPHTAGDNLTVKNFLKTVNPPLNKTYLTGEVKKKKVLGAEVGNRLYVGKKQMFKGPPLQQQQLQPSPPGPFLVPPSLQPQPPPPDLFPVTSTLIHSHIPVHSNTNVLNFMPGHE